MYQPATSNQCCITRALSYTFFQVPRASGAPPVPQMHSPPRNVTAKDQQDWKIPPCISNWKNPKGYTIPLDKRLAADGRGLQVLLLVVPYHEEQGQLNCISRASFVVGRTTYPSHCAGNLSALLKYVSIHCTRLNHQCNVEISKRLMEVGSMVPIVTSSSSLARLRILYSSAPLWRTCSLHLN